MPLVAPTCSRLRRLNLPETPYVKPGSTPEVFQYSTRVKLTADIKFFKETNSKLEDTLLQV